MDSIPEPSEGAITVKLTMSGLPMSCSRGSRAANLCLLVCQVDPKIVRKIQWIMVSSTVYFGAYRLTVLLRLHGEGSKPSCTVLCAGR